jgi:hypothetical protein
MLVAIPNSSNTGYYLYDLSVGGFLSFVDSSRGSYLGLSKISDADSSVWSISNFISQTPNIGSGSGNLIGASVGVYPTRFGSNLNSETCSNKADHYMIEILPPGAAGSTTMNLTSADKDSSTGLYQVRAKVYFKTSNSELSLNANLVTTSVDMTPALDSDGNLYNPVWCEGVPNPMPSLVCLSTVELSSGLTVPTACGESSLSGSDFGLWRFELTQNNVKGAPWTVQLFNVTVQQDISGTVNQFSNPLSFFKPDSSDSPNYWVCTGSCGLTDISPCSPGTSAPTLMAYLTTEDWYPYGPTPAEGTGYSRALFTP